MPWLDKDTYQLPPVLEAIAFGPIVILLIVLWLSTLILGPIAPIAIILYVIGVIIS